MLDTDYSFLGKFLERLSRIDGFSVRRVSNHAAGRQPKADGRKKRKRKRKQAKDSRRRNWK